MKINVPLSDVRPHWLRLLICIIYFPMVIPILIILSGIAVTWSEFVVPCVKGHK